MNNLQVRFFFMKSLLDSNDEINFPFPTEGLDLVWKKKTHLRLD